MYSDITHDQLQLRSTPRGRSSHRTATTTKDSSLAPPQPASQR